MNRKTGTIYNPDKNVRSEERVRAAWEGSNGPKYLKGTAVEVYIHVHEDGAAIVVTPMEVGFKPSIAGDIDNYAKTLLDGLNGVAWDDDSQVLKLTVLKS